MKWNFLNKDDAHAKMLTWVDEPVVGCNNENLSLREDILNIFKIVVFDLELSKNEIHKSGYKFDLHFGIKLFSLLNENYNFSLREACDDNIWRYLSVNVVPDIVYSRWGNNPSRFWKVPRRIWLKTLWWYIYLSWQDDEISTQKILINNSTDEIVQLVERSGQSGYRIESYREIMCYFGNMSQEDRKKDSKLFRKVMKLNTARCKVVEPLLVEGGVSQYVKELFCYFEENEQ